MLRKLGIFASTNIRCFATVSSTVDPNEVSHFQKLVLDWWDEFGAFKPLHSMNKLRIPLIRDGLINVSKVPNGQINTPAPLKGISVLDVGCGGGILSEPLANIGCNVTGIDAVPGAIEQAKLHAKSSNFNITYLATSIEEHASKHRTKYDAIVASEVIEHVTNKQDFIEACVTCLKPGGSIFITTISQTCPAKIAAIIIAENVLNLIPPGTHQYEKFIEPHKMQRILEDNNCRTHLIHGMFYNFLTNNWCWCSDTSVNYALHAIKINEC